MTHLKVFWLWIKETNKRFWAYWFGFTELDNKVLAAYEEARNRYRKVVDAVKGK